MFTLVLRIHQNDLIIDIRSILIHPIAVQHAQVRAAASDALLGQSAVRASRILLVDTLRRGLAVHDTSVHRFLAATPTNASAVNHVALECRSTSTKHEIQKNLRTCLALKPNRRA